MAEFLLLVSFCNCTWTKISFQHNYCPDRCSRSPDLSWQLKLFLSPPAKLKLIQEHTNKNKSYKFLLWTCPGHKTSFWDIDSYLRAVFLQGQAWGVLKAFGNGACCCLVFMLSVKTIKDSRAFHPILCESTQNWKNCEYMSCYINLK